VTLLTNYAMPLIRYRIGDLASWAPEPCPCGRGWPLLQDVTGRSTSSFVAADGASTLSRKQRQSISKVVTQGLWPSAGGGGR